MRGPQPGDLAPDFEGTTHLGDVVRLRDLRGRFVVLYFYMKAFSPNCIQQARAFRDNHDDLKALGAEVLGVSIDPMPRQCTFARYTGVTFPLIADEDRAISEAFGAARALLPLDRRITFLIDPAGIVRMRFQHQFQVNRHLDNVVGALRELIDNVPVAQRLHARDAAPSSSSLSSSMAAPLLRPILLKE